MTRHPAAIGALLLSLSSLPAQTGGEKLDRDDALFGLAKVHKLHLTAAAWNAMQPPLAAKFPGFGQKQPAPARSAPSSPG